MPGKALLAQLRQRDANVPVVFLADKTPVGENNDPQGAVVDFIVKSHLTRQVFIGRAQTPWSNSLGLKTEVPG